MTSRGEYSLHVYEPIHDRQLPLLLLISGEGGWRNFDQRLAGYFQKQGFWVGGVDCLKYFWKPQDDRRALASDMRAYAATLARAAHRSEDSRLVLAGFSFGADLAPWIAGGGGWGDRVAGLIMLGPDDVGSLQFRVLEIFGFEEHDHIFQVSEALASSRGIPVLFIHGGDDEHSSAPHLAEAVSSPKKLLTVPKADHHFNGRESELRHSLVEGVEWLLGLDPPTAASPKEHP
jgi:type IV secretory pathway VirJ component